MLIVRAAIRFSARGNTSPMRLSMPPLTRTFAATLFATILGNLATICLACAVFGSARPSRKRSILR